MTDREGDVAAVAAVVVVAAAADVTDVTITAAAAATATRSLSDNNRYRSCIGWKKLCFQTSAIIEFWRKKVCAEKKLHVAKKSVKNKMQVFKQAAAKLETWVPFVTLVLFFENDELRCRQVYTALEILKGFFVTGWCSSHPYEMLFQRWSPRLFNCQDLNPCPQHQLLPSGLSSKFHPGPTLLNASVLMGTGVFSMVRLLAEP